MTHKYFEALPYSETLALAKRVCDVVGHGKAGSRVDLIMEVIYWKSLNGNVKPNKLHRYGIAQLSGEGIKIVQRSKKEKTIHCMALLTKEFFIKLEEVKPIELEESPLLSICFLALISINISQNIPMARQYGNGEPEGRAEFSVKYGSTVYDSMEVKNYLNACSILDAEAEKAALSK